MTINYATRQKRNQRWKCCRKTKQCLPLYCIVHFLIQFFCLIPWTFISPWLEQWVLSWELIICCLVLNAVPKSHNLSGCSCIGMPQNQREHEGGWTQDGCNWSKVWQQPMTSITRVCSNIAKELFTCITAAGMQPCGTSEPTFSGCSNLRVQVL